MQFLGQYRAIVVFVALSALASAFYFTLWSSIDPENVFNGEGIANSISRTFRHQQRPLPVPASELRPPVDSSDPTTNSLAPVKLGPKKLLLLQKHAYKQQKQAERLQRHEYKQRKQAERLQKHAYKQRIEAEREQKHAYKQRIQAEREQKHAYKQRIQAEREENARQKQRIRDAENEPFPSLITANNARVDALNLRAYNKLCLPEEEGTESNGHEGSAGGGREHLSLVATTEQDHDTTKKNVDFTTFEEWTQYIQNKNSGQEQTEPSPPPVLADQEESSPIPVSTTPKLHRPLFLERPLRGWIVNMTALKEPCNRHEHTSAHCLAYLSRDHEYLMPSRQARKLPNSSTARKKLHDTPFLPMDFHIFWKGLVSDKLWMSVHAFLFTQPLDRAHLHLWIDSSDLPGGVAEDYEKNEFAKPIVAPAVAEHVQIHAWDQKALEEFAYGSQTSQQDLSPSTGPATPPVALSDEARFLILYRYGGMYLDADVLLLRDMSPFYDAGREFAYEWSNTEMYNTAVLRLKQNSSVARRILDGAKARAKEVQEMQWRKEHHGEVRLEEHAEVAPPQEAPSQHQELIENDKQPRGQDLSETKVEEIQGHNTGEPMKAIPLAATTPITNAAKAINAEDNDEIGSSEDDSLFLPTDADAMSATQGSAAIMATISSHRLVKRGEMRPKEVYHPARLRQYLRPQDSKIEGNGLNMLPVAVFDPLWLRVDDADGATEAAMRDPERMMPALTSFPDAFSSKEAICPGQSQTFAAGPEVFFAGAYAYHWHNNWKTPIEPQSWMGLMRQAYDDFTAGQRPNLYGEWFSGETDNEEY